MINNFEQGGGCAFFKSFICIGLTIGALNAVAGLAAQSHSIHGPILGFIPDRGGTAILPILGVPGASILGDRLEFGVDIRGAVISPKQDYAIAMRSEDAQLVVIDLAGSSTLVSSIVGTHPGADVIAISPTGSTAALYDHESRTVQAIGHLPHAPELIHEFDTSHIQGHGTGMAVSDDGAMVLVKFVDEDGAVLWAMDSSGGSWRISSDRPSAAAFFPNRRDAVVTDDATQSAFLITDVGQAATRVPLVSAVDGINGFLSVSVSEDSAQVFFADSNSGAVAIVNMETRRTVVASCWCQPTGLYRLKGTSVFRLTDPSREAMTVLDVSSTDPRIVVIPPAAYE